MSNTLYRTVSPRLFEPEMEANLRVATARAGVLVTGSQAFVEALGRQERYILMAPGIYTLYGDINVSKDDVVLQGCGWGTEIRFVQDAELLFSGDHVTVRDMLINGNDVTFARGTYANKATGAYFKAFNVWFKDADGGLSLQGNNAHVKSCLVTGHTTCGILVSGDRCRIAMNEVEGLAGFDGDIRVEGDNNLVNLNQIPGGDLADVGAGNDTTVNLT